MVKASTIVGPGMDPAYWPRIVFENVEYNIVNPQCRSEKSRFAYETVIAPIVERIRKIRIAYQISCYPLIRQEQWQYIMKGELERDQEIWERDEVVLDGAEREILRRFCETPRYSIGRDDRLIRERAIPFDPQKEVYRYAEVLSSPECAYGWTPNDPSPSNENP